MSCTAVFAELNGKRLSPWIYSVQNRYLYRNYPRDMKWGLRPRIYIDPSSNTLNQTNKLNYRSQTSISIEYNDVRRNSPQRPRG